MSRSWRRAALSQGLWLALAGCAVGWQRITLTPMTAVAPTQVLEVWHGSEHPQWHGVILSADSISGIPFFRPLDCHDCRTTVSLAQVDSTRWGDPVTPGVAAGLAPVAAIVILMLMAGLSRGYD